MLISIVCWRCGHEAGHTYHQCLLGCRIFPCGTRCFCEGCKFMVQQGELMSRPREGTPHANSLMHVQCAYRLAAAYFPHLVPEQHGGKVPAFAVSPPRVLAPMGSPPALAPAPMPAPVPASAFVFTTGATSPSTRATKIARVAHASGPALASCAGAQFAVPTFGSGFGGPTPSTAVGRVMRDAVAFPTAVSQGLSSEAFPPPPARALSRARGRARAHSCADAPLLLVMCCEMVKIRKLRDLGSELST